MSTYRDRYGQRIRIGDAVLVAITINHDVCRLFPWTMCIVRKRGRELILDGAHCWSRLREMKAAELAKVVAGLDLRQLYIEFRKEFPPSESFKTDAPEELRALLVELLAWADSSPVPWDDDSNSEAHSHRHDIILAKLRKFCSVPNGRRAL